MGMKYGHIAREQLSSASESEAESAAQSRLPARSEFTALQQVFGNRVVQWMHAKDGGRTMPATVQRKLGGALGADLSQVRIHESPDVRAAGAIAWTRGDHVHFAPGRYDPWSRAGQQVLGHELAHVVQQRAGRVAAPAGGEAPVNADPGLEAEADRWGGMAARAEPVREARPQGHVAAAPGGAVQMLQDQELTGFLKWVEDQLKTMNVLEPHRTVALQAAAQVGAAQPSRVEAEATIKQELANAWATPRALLGDTYLELRDTLRTERPNAANSRSPGSRANCSLVAVAALLGTNTTDVAQKLGFQQPGAAQGPTAFLGPQESANYNDLGGLHDHLAHERIGTQAQYLATHAASGKSEATLRGEYRNLRMSLDLSPDQVMARMAAFTVQQLGPGAKATTRGSVHAMLAVAEGIDAMKAFPPGTQFIVYMTGDETGAHYVYANNKGGDVHITDYQPLAVNVRKSPPEELQGALPSVLAMVQHEEGWIPAAHPHAVNAVTPPPFTVGGDAAFTELCFVAFEVSAAHISNYIKDPRNRIQH